MSIADPGFAPKLQLLLGLLRSACGATAEEPPTPGVPIDWTAFLALVERHRVGALLHRRAPAPLAAQCPERIVHRLNAIAAANARRALARAAEQIRLVRLLESAAVPVVAVKGLVLAQQLYGDLETRHAGDIDLLVRMDDVERADAALQAGGLRRSRPDFRLTPRQTREYLRLKPEFEYVRAPAALRVELLWRLEGVPVGESIWDRPSSLLLGGQPMRTLPPETEALYLFQHGSRHGWFRLFWLLDVALLLRERRLDWSAIVAESRRAGTERALLQGAALAADLLGAPRPAALGPGPEEQGVVSSLAREARRRIARPAVEHEGVVEWARQLAYRTRLQKTARAKYATVAPHLFSPASWRMWPLPDRWFFLYYFATPFLWIWRRVRRRS